jgi:hypothetical protein
VLVTEYIKNRSVITSLQLQQHKQQIKNILRIDYITSLQKHLVTIECWKFANFDFPFSNSNPFSPICRSSIYNIRKNHTKSISDIVVSLLLQARRIVINIIFLALRISYCQKYVYYYYLACYCENVLSLINAGAIRLLLSSAACLWNWM